MQIIGAWGTARVLCKINSCTIFVFFEGWQGGYDWHQWMDLSQAQEAQMIRALTAANHDIGFGSLGFFNLDTYQWFVADTHAE
jgi:hypothetical protein